MIIKKTVYVNSNGVLAPTATDRNGFQLTGAGLTFKRGDSVRLNVVFLDSANQPITIPDGSVITMAVKPLNEYDSTILYAYQTVTVNGQAAADGYNLDFTLDGLDLYDALRVNAPLEADVASVSGMLELTWTQDGGTTYASTQNEALFIVNNDVIRGNEATPINLPSPESWLNMRAVRYDTPQALSLSQQQRAQQNIGLPKAKWDGNRAPNADDDETLGYSAGSLWIDVIGKEAYRCVDSSEGAAEWIETTFEVTEIGGGPNLITDSTQTTLEGFLYGESGSINARVGSTSDTPDTVAIRTGSGSLNAASFEGTSASFTGNMYLGQTSANTSLSTAATANQIVQFPNASGYVALTTNATGSASNIEIYAKAATAITKGAVVYISGAAGENKIISPAIANGEATSSKTIGVAIQSLAQNGFGYVLTEGDITGLGIALTQGHGIVEGDPIWLSPTVAGGMVFKVANKPAAPNHMVFIGYVTKVDGNTLDGIYVKVQNGFELEELHNVQISSPSNNQVLTYDSVNGLWKNTTPAASGVVAPTADTVVKRNDFGGVHANHIRVFNGDNYAQINAASNPESDQLSFSLPPAAGTIATNNTAVMLSGDQLTIGGNKSFSGLIQMANQNADDSTNALTVGVGDARYGATYVGIKNESVSSSDNTAIKLTSVILPAGTYQLDSYIAASAAASNGGYLFGLRASSAVKTSMIDLYGSDGSSPTNNTITSDNLMLSQRSIPAGNILTSKRHITGLLVVTTNNTEVSIEFSQATTVAGVPSATRVRSFITARKIA